MSTAAFLMRVSQGVFNRMRSPKADTVTDATAYGSLNDFRGHKYCLAITYRRDGEAIPTPVWFGIADGKLYFRTLVNNGKTKRIRNNGRVRIAPCDVRGTPTGPVVDCHGRLLGQDEELQAESAIRDNYGLGRRLYSRVMAGKVDGLYVEVTPLHSRHAAPEAVDGTCTISR